MASGKLEPGDWLAQLSELADDEARGAFFESRSDLRQPETQEQLGAEILRLARQDLPRAERLAEASRWLAESMADDHGRASSSKSFGNLSYVAGRFEQALTHYRAAIELFFELGAEIEAAITISSSLQSRILLGRYSEAAADAQRARAIFERHGEKLLLARLDSNEANIYLRQSRLAEASKRYQGVLPLFREQGEPQDLAVALYNLAVCRIGLHEFPQALKVYRELSAHCSQHGMALIAAQADYNIAYLYFLRGEYMRSLELYRRTRDRCEELGDPYHRSLCDLDRAEIHLELNLTTDAAGLAESAFKAFETLGNGYEAAKALCFRAIAAHQQLEADRALELFHQAYRRFERENNRVWLAVIDLYRALIHYDQHRLAESRRLAIRAMTLFMRFRQTGKEILCQVLLARIELATDQPRAARKWCVTALSQLEEIDVAASTYHAHFVLGQVEEALGDRLAAIDAYQNAHRMLESLRSHLRGEELKIAFFKDKQDIYQSLVWMTLEGEPSSEVQRATFLYIEQAKSRSLADLIAFRADALSATGGAHRELAEALRQQRDELNWTYRQIDLRELKLAERAREGTQGGARRLQVTVDKNAVGGSAVGESSLEEPTEMISVEALRERCRVQEQRLLRALAKLRAKDAELGSLQAAGSLELDELQAAVPEGTLLLEYFEARGSLLVGVLSPSDLEVRRLGCAEKVLEHLDYFQHQLSQFQLTPDFVEIFGARMYRDSLVHLGELHAELIAPVADRLDVDRLIVVPHGSLHYVPFHALWDGEKFLLDRFIISYAPSASVFAMCCAKPPARGDKALVLGVPDEQAPQIRDEVEAVAASLTDAELFVGEQATEKRLRTLGPQSRWIHIATHGFFRQDNPMFSAIQLGTTRLTLFDLYHLDLSSELVVLSGCATGAHHVEGGDELIGLTRGLLYAGTHSALVTLWDVHDASTAKFMTALYQQLEISEDRALAVRQAMLKLRESYAHPYYWAPFVLIGKPATSWTSIPDSGG